MSKTRMDIESIDVSADIGPMYPEESSAPGLPYPMYSFNKPAYAFWSGIAKGLMAQGLTYKQALTLMQSKQSRWLFDLHYDKVESLGKEMAWLYETGKDPHAHD